jgi:hypothetical protein
LIRAANDLHVHVSLARTPAGADVVLTLKAHEKRQPGTLKDLEDQGARITVIRSNTVSQMKLFLQREFGIEDQKSEEEEAMHEAEEALDRVDVSWHSCGTGAAARKCAPPSALAH